MKKYLIILSVISVLTGHAQVYDKMVLMDGSMVEGHITAQHPGKDIVFQSGDKEVSYPLEDILAIVHARRQADDLSGIDDVIETKAGKVYKGQIVKHLRGKAVYLYEDNGMTQIVSNADIACQRREKLNQEQRISEQTPFLDVVVTGNGIYKGVIILKDYGSDDHTAFLCILDGQGQQQKVDMAAVTELRREPNRLYAPVTAFRVGEKEVYFNRNLTGYTVYTTGRDGALRIKRDILLQCPVIKDRRLTVETQDNESNRHGILVRCSLQGEGKKRVLLFSYKDMLTSPVPSVQTTTSSGTLRKEYVTEPGFYVYFVPQTKKAYVCEIR